MRRAVSAALLAWHETPGDTSIRRAAPSGPAGHAWDVTRRIDTQARGGSVMRTTRYPSTSSTASAAVTVTTSSVSRPRWILSPGFHVGAFRAERAEVFAGLGEEFVGRHPGSFRLSWGRTGAREATARDMIRALMATTDGVTSHARRRLRRVDPLLRLARDLVRRVLWLPLSSRGADSTGQGRRCRAGSATPTRALISALAPDLSHFTLPSSHFVYGLGYPIAAVPFLWLGLSYDPWLIFDGLGVRLRGRGELCRRGPALRPGRGWGSLDSGSFSRRRSWSTA